MKEERGSAHAKRRDICIVSFNLFFDLPIIKKTTELYYNETKIAHLFSNIEAIERVSRRVMQFKGII